VLDPEDTRLDDLAQAAAAGDRPALERLLAADHARLHALCWRLCGNGSDADDAAQEALLAIARGIRRFDGRAAYRTWSYRVATNACLDELRRRGRRPRPVADEQLDRAGAGDVAEQVVALVDVDRLLADLADDHRAVIVLRELCGLDYAALAEVLEVPVGTVRSRLARARAALADAAGNSPGPSDRPRAR
jgi:RNA polymerase sigma-70 factor (ECF subfamily)